MCGRLSLSSADHRIAAELLAGAVPGFEPEGLSRWLARAGYEPRPAIVRRDRVLDWLGTPPAEASAALETRALGLESMPVSTAFNASRHAGPIVGCDPARDAPDPRRLEL